MTAATRHRLLPGREGAAVRDLDKFARSLVPLTVVSFADVYAEPMTLAFPRKPHGVLLISLLEDAEPETPIAAFAFVHTTYTQQGIRINALEGPLLGERYRYTFLIVG